MNGCQLTLSKANLLTKAHQKAPRLFNATTSPVSCGKRKRRRRPSTITEQSDSQSNRASTTILLKSYPDSKVQQLLKAHGALWRSKSLSILQNWEQACSSSSHPNSTVRIYAALEQIDQRDETNNILQRILCVAFSELHRKGRNVEEITLQIRDSQVVECNDLDKVKARVYKILQAGYKWQKIVHLCRTSSGRERSSGILYILGKSWA